jgi:hypothetical protein
MATTDPYKWQFKPRFRRQAFGWKSEPAITRIKEAISEIKKVAKKDPLLGAEGAVVFFERISPAIENVDGSSGAIGSAVNRAVEELVPIIANAPADEKTRNKWLERLWKAHEEDRIPYIESLADYWGELCATKELASSWADYSISAVRLCNAADSRLGDYFHGTSACLSALLKAERYDDLLELCALPGLWLFHYQQYAVKALAAQGRRAEALRHAENTRDQYSDNAVARVCEEILLSSGFADEAYERYGIEANQRTSHLSTYRALAKKYPHKKPEQILKDLVDTTPGEEGKWFATAKELGFFELALKLARTSPCDPRTLTRASRDYLDVDPAFAMCSGLTALQWLIEGYGYEITRADVWEAYKNTVNAAEKVGETDNIMQVLRRAVQEKSSGNNLVGQVLAEQLGLVSPKR